MSRNQGHFDPQGVHPGDLGGEGNLALGDVLRDLGTGLIQSGGGNGAEMKDALMSRLSGRPGAPGLQHPGQTMRRPGQWQSMAQVDATKGKASAPS